MALTAEGKALTASHQRQQIALATRAQAASRPIWKSVLRAQGVWLASQIGLLADFYARSQDLTEAYLEAYRSAEGVAPSGFERASFPVAEMTSVMLVGGPYSVKNLIGDGLTGDQALAKGFNKFSGLVSRQVLSGGRLLIADSTANDRNAIGWRRVSDGNPCTFCAMLVTRGPVYKSRETADSIAGKGTRYHAHCGCTAEIVYGAWEPTKAEEQMINSYVGAAMTASAVDGIRVQNTVLWRMRAAGHFRDSPAVRGKK